MKKWQKILVSPDTPILKALKIIDESSMQIALVADEQQRLLGTVTDGDIRRAILNGLALENPVSQVMNPHPVTARLNDGKDNVLALMKMKSLRNIPVLDDGGVITGIQMLDELLKTERRENLVVLMAGGMGTRLRPLTEDCPKPLIMVGSKPILETIIESFIEYGFYRFLLSVNYKAEMLEEYFGDGSRWGVEIEYLHEDKVMGTVGPLGLLSEQPTLPLLVMNGDLLTKVNFQQLLDYHLAHRSVATMCLREYTFQIPYGVAKLEDQRLVGIEEKPVQHHFVSAGIYVLDPMVLDLIPSGSYYDMPDLFKYMITRNLDVGTFPIREYWLDIGRMDDLDRAKGDYSELFK